MDHLKKRRINTFGAIEKEFGRMLRNMSAHRMFPYSSDNHIPATDVYETASEYVVYMEIPGVGKEKLSVVAAHSSVTVTGLRPQPAFNDTSCIHQLEVEYGSFERTIPFQTSIDPNATTSTYKNGFLLIRLPKKTKPENIKVTITGE